MGQLTVENLMYLSAEGRVASMRGDAEASSAEPGSVQSARESKDPGRTKVLTLYCVPPPARTPIVLGQRIYVTPR